MVICSDCKKEIILDPGSGALFSCNCNYISTWELGRRRMMILSSKKLKDLKDNYMRTQMSRSNLNMTSSTGSLINCRIKEIDEILAERGE